MKTIKFNTLKYLALKNNLKLNRAYNLRVSCYPVNLNVPYRALQDAINNGNCEFNYMQFYITNN